MHTVNKAYTVLRQEGFVNIDRRRGAVIAVDVNKARALQEMKETLAILLAKEAVEIFQKKKCML